MPLIARGQITISDLNDPIQQGTAPVNPTEGLLWLDTSETPNMLKRWNGSEWVNCSAEPEVDLTDYYTKTEMDTLYEQTQEAIALKADKNVTDEMGNRLEAAEATLITQADEISATTTKATSAYNTINSLTIGGRNYLIGSQRVLELSSPDEPTNVWSTNGLALAEDFLTDCTGKNVRFSLYYMFENAEKVSGAWVGLQVKYNLSNGSTGSNACTVHHLITTGSRAWTRYSVTLYVPPTAISVNSIMLTIQYCKGQVRLKNPMIELGNRTSDYRPAIEDMQVVQQTTAPVSPYLNMLWLDTSIVPSQLKRWTGSMWTIVNDVAGIKDQLDDAKDRITATESRLSTAEFKLKPDQLATSVKSSSVFLLDKAQDRNYVTQSYASTIFQDTFVMNGTTVTANKKKFYGTSNRLFEHSSGGKSLRLGFDIKRTDIVTTDAESRYFGCSIRYYYYNESNVWTEAHEKFYLKTTDAYFKATDTYVTRIYIYPIDLTSLNPRALNGVYMGVDDLEGVTGTIEVKNLKLEIGNTSTTWTPAPEDQGNMNSRLTTAESKITQNTNSIALKVNTSTYNIDKVYRAAAAPSVKYANMLWLDLSLSPPILKRWTGSAWVSVGAQEMKTSGIYIGSNNVKITTEQFLLQLLDPANNENVLMEMSATGHVGFKELFADKVISPTVAGAYAGPSTLYVNSSYAGNSDTYFRTLSEACEAVSHKYLPYDVSIVLPSNGILYEGTPITIQGVNGPGRLRIGTTYSNCTVYGYIKVLSCSAFVNFSCFKLVEVRAVESGGALNPNQMSVVNCHFVKIDNVVFDACDVTYSTIDVSESTLSLLAVAFYNTTDGISGAHSIIYLHNCLGSCWVWLVELVGGFLFASGSIPYGSVSTSSGAQFFDESSYVDYGSGAPAVEPDVTSIIQASSTRTWRNGWRTDTYDMVQGAYSDAGYSSGVGWNRGCVWFAAARELQGATIRSATLTLHRKPGNGSFSARTVYLYGISNTSASGTPQLTTSFGALGVIGRDSQVTFSLPLSAITGLVNGTYGGLCIYEASYDFGSSAYSQDYLRISGTDANYNLWPYLTVVHSDIGGNG